MGSNHEWVTGGEPPAFLVCRFCGLEHTTRDRLGKPKRGNPPFWIRQPEGDWEPRVPPIPACPWRKWVRDVVGRRFEAPDAGGIIRIWVCYGFDPRHGFRLRTIDDRGPEYRKDVSPRSLLV